VSFRVHDLAVIQAVSTASGREVGWADAPKGALEKLIQGTGNGYYICDPTPGGSRDGTAKDPWVDWELVYQFRCIDRGPEGVQWLVDKIDPFPTLTIPGRRVLWVRPQSSGVWPDEDTANPTLYFSTPTFRIKTTPA